MKLEDVASDNTALISSPRILVSTFAFNEHVKIEATVERIMAANLEREISNSFVEVLVVDDGSADNYPEMLQEKHGFTLLRNEQNMGIGYSIRRAIEYAAAHDFDILVIMAGNNKDEPREIPTLVQPVISGAADFVQGSRYARGGAFGGDMPLYRRLATRAHPFAVWLATGRLLSDTTNGFRAIRLSSLGDQRWHLEQAWLNRYGLEYYLLFHFLTGPYKVREVPVSKTYPKKSLGTTKIKPISGWWDILKPLLLLGLRIKR